MAVFARRHTHVQHSPIAIALDGESQTGQREPRQRIPWHQRERPAGHEQQERISRRDVRQLMRDHDTLFVNGALQQPRGHDNARGTYADDCGTECPGYAHGNTVNDMRRRPEQLPAMPAIAQRKYDKHEA